MINLNFNPFFKRVRCLTSRLYLYFMFLYFKFNHWHIVGNINCRPYKKKLANIINNLNPECVIEIGCGLGEILLNVKSQIRKGYDIDRGAINYLKSLNYTKAEFFFGSFDEIIDTKIDVLILINWMHDVDELFLKERILKLVPKCKYILLDVIDDSASATYKYKHQFFFLNDIAQSKNEYRFENEPRTFILFQLP